MRKSSTQLDLFADYAPPVPAPAAAMNPKPAPAAIMPFPLVRTRHVAILAGKLAAMAPDAARVTFYKRELAQLIAQRQRQGLCRDVAVADVEQLHLVVKFMIEARPAPHAARQQAPAPIIPMPVMAVR